MRHWLAVTIVLNLMAFMAFPAYADAETDALRQEIKLLEARLAVLEKREQARERQAVAAAPATGSKLEARVAAIEEKQAAPPGEQAKIEVNSKGLSVTSPDKQYLIRLHAYAQADNRTYVGRGGGTDTFLVRAARPVVDAKMTDYFSGRFMIDFGKGNMTLLDAYGDLHAAPASDVFNLRFGEFKVPVGLERWQSEQELAFVERGLTTNLVPYRDIGLMAYGQIIPKQLEYQLGVMNGAADLQANTGDADSDKDVAGRVFAHPFRTVGIPALAGFGAGVGGTYGQHRGTAAAPQLTVGYVTIGQRSFFTYKGTSYASGTQWRLNPQAYYYYGPFGALGEYVLNSQDMANGGSHVTLRNDAWMAEASYVLTGENASFEGIVPKRNFNPSNGDWGAFELAARYSALHVDHAAFSMVADPAISARRAREATAGINWYFNPAVKLNLDFSFTSFDGGAAAGGDRPDEKAVLTRTQFKF